MEFLIVHIWYFIAGFLGFFIWRRKRKKLLGNKKILIFSHRGAKGHALDNSLPAIKKGLEIGVDYIEVDIRRSRDGVFVLSHDDRILGRNNRKYSVSKQMIDVLKKLSLPGKNKIVTLDELVRFLPPSQKIMLDIKEWGFEFELLSFLRMNHLTDRVIISSYFAKSLRLLKVLEPDLIVGLSFPRERFSTLGKVVLFPFWAPLLLLVKHTYPFYIGLLSSWAKADFMAVNFKLLTGRLVKAAHKRDIMVFVFSFPVDRDRDIRKMMRLGVDGIIANSPDKVKREIKETSREESER